MRNEGAVVSPEEQQGYEVFKQKCASCHKEPLFTDMSFRNNGLALTTEPDDGRYLISLNETEKNKFKVPSLRNLKFTFPYMHDGRFYTIDEVLDHYSSGMVKTPNIDPLFITPNGSLGVSLSEQDKLHLNKFLLTLNDTSFVKNPRFDEPGSQYECEVIILVLAVRDIARLPEGGGGKSTGIKRGTYLEPLIMAF